MNYRCRLFQHNQYKNVKLKVCEWRYIYNDTCVTIYDMESTNTCWIKCHRVQCHILKNITWSTITHDIQYIIELNAMYHGVQWHMIYHISLSLMPCTMEYNDTWYTIYHWVQWHMCYLPWSLKTHVKLDSTEFNDTCYLPWSPKTHVILCTLEFNDTCAVQYTMLTHVLYTNVHMFYYNVKCYLEYM